GFVNLGPAADRAGIHSEPVLERFEREFLDGIADVLPHARDINKTKIHDLHIMFSGKFENAFRIHQYLHRSRPRLVNFIRAEVTAWVHSASSPQWHSVQCIFSSLR